MTEQHSLRISPLPTPEDLAGYKEVMPDLPQCLIEQFVADSENDRELRRNAQKADIVFDKRSQWMAFLIIMFGLAGTFFLSYLDKNIAAVVTGLGTAALIFKGTFSKHQ